MGHSLAGFAGSLRLAPHPGDRDESLLEPLPVIEAAADLRLYPLVGKQTHHIWRVDQDVDMTLVGMGGLLRRNGRTTSSE